MWMFALLFVLVHGAFCTAPGAYWVLETLKCSENRVILQPNKNLMETTEALDHMCRQQNEFYHCLENMVIHQALDAIAVLPSEIQHERSIINDLCSKDSVWRSRYLKYATCINLQQTDFCMTSEFLNADTEDNSLCDLREKMVNCIAATLTMKCGIEAGHLFHHLLKMTKDDCRSETSSCQDSELTCKGNFSEEKEIYDKLFKRMGDIPDQDVASSLQLEEDSSSIEKSIDLDDETATALLDFSEEKEIYDQLFKRMGDIPDQDVASSLQLEEDGSSIEKSIDFDDETATASLDFEGAAISDSSDVENEIPVFLIDTVDDQADTVTVDYDSMSELITSALNDLDENSEADSTASTNQIYIVKDSNCENPEIATEQYCDTNLAGISLALSPDLKQRYEEISMETEDYETSRIFPDGRINLYRRHNSFIPIEFVECRHFPEYFRCVSMHRQKDPQCFEQALYIGPKTGEFFPEEFDPEFGAKLYETLPKRKYIFKQWLDQSKDESDSQSYSSTLVSEDTKSSYISEDSHMYGRHEVEYAVNSGKEFSTGNKYSELNWSTSHCPFHKSSSTRVSEDLSPSMLQDSDESETESELETVSKLFNIFTAAWPKISGIKETNLLPKDIADSMEELFTYKSGFLRNAILDTDDFGNFYMYWSNQQNSHIDTIRCGRANECHPKGEGIWKCVIVPKEAEKEADGETATTE